MVGKEAYERSSTFKELAIKYNIALSTIQLILVIFKLSIQIFQYIQLLYSLLSIYRIEQIYKN